eukprot:7854098-Pyramimonas_sp.AAC.1
MAPLVPGLPRAPGCCGSRCSCPCGSPAFSGPWGVFAAAFPSPAHGGERPLPMGASAVRGLVSRCVSLRCLSMTLGQSTWSWYSLSIL